MSTTLVISQVYGGGGNSGATYTNDIIEIFNRGATTVDVSTWSEQYAPAAGTTWQVTNLFGSIPPGGYYLVQEAQGMGSATPLPAPDAREPSRCRQPTARSPRHQRLPVQRNG